MKKEFHTNDIILPKNPTNQEYAQYITEQERVDEFNEHHYHRHPKHPKTIYKIPENPTKEEMALYITEIEEQKSWELDKDDMLEGIVDDLTP